MKGKRVAIYTRVSTSDQSVEPQLLDLRRFTRERRWELFREYTDHGISGTKDSRPALNALMEDARKRRFVIVLVWRFDRFARSTRHLILALEEFRHLEGKMRGQVARGDHISMRVSPGKKVSGVSGASSAPRADGWAFTGSTRSKSGLSESLDE